MARKLIRRIVPSPAAIKDKPGLRFLGGLLQNSSLFHLNRRSVSLAFFVGIFVAFLPMPFQMGLAAVLALWVRCNLPLALALVWITNPLTMPVIFFVTYQLGRWLLQTPPMTVSLELSWHWLVHEFALIWKPLLVGSVLAGLFFATLGAISIQIFWRWQVAKSWQLRKLRRRQRTERKTQNNAHSKSLKKAQEDSQRHS